MTLQLQPRISALSLLILLSLTLATVHETQSSILRFPDVRGGRAGAGGVQNMKINPPSKDPSLMKYLDLFLNQKASSGTLQGFSYKNCGNASELLHINGLSISPDPVKIPGTVTIKFDAIIKQNIDAPLKMVLKVEKKEGPIWITLPCIEGIGSCTYDDLCDTLSGAVCPDPFMKHDIPCKCPFNQGHYTLPSGDFPISVEGVPNGEYYGKAELTYKSQLVSCIELYFDLA